MAGRNYPKGAAKREEILDVALETVAENGYNAATIRTIAEAAGLSKTGVGHHFASKYELLTAVLARRDEAGVEATQDAGVELLFDAIREALAEHAKEAGLTELYVRLAAEASDPSNVAHEFFVDRYRRLEEFGVDELSELQRAGGVPRDLDPRVLSVLIAAVVDGLSLRLLYEPELDPEPVVDALRGLLAAAAKAAPES
ncbi:TetR/AcrR family transcriptional regulator [Demequina salsinemoris]|uniref:TetR/AcrR family transcriptional regulator n=1 Tax=Demequina salsinemoris TaxID=577470 RepID=UPI00078370C1|nr:TetR/AcrR family transcriptional regulator [Demequina salsinemoris]